MIGSSFHYLRILIEPAWLSTHLLREVSLSRRGRWGMYQI